MIWGGSKLLPEKWLDALRFPVEIETFFSAQFEVVSKKTKKVFTETETVFWQWCAQISRLFAQINRPFAQIFDDFRRFEPNGGAFEPNRMDVLNRTPCPPRLLQLCPKVNEVFAVNPNWFQENQTEESFGLDLFICQKMLSKPFHEKINRTKRPCRPHKTASRAKCGPQATGWAALL